jgi:hypothetical protein|tara:strand:- start:31 stop:399 length:369 start_codon:yes stop_codon:yes gene_type:complete
MHLYVRLEYANTVADNDGRSIFGALYIVIALVSIFEFFNIMANTTMGNAFVAPCCLFFAVFFGIAGIHKLSTDPHKVELNNEIEDNIEKKKYRNSNLEIRILKNKKMLAIIIVIALFIITRF